ncbi:hypothetical protein F5890DRAFT_1478644 [Lentinula detonsa]|uniref:Uncharacterized protein n=1 Tax=Lentinula detonsa TaxID=2804962 RepID=A0AA38PP95_9AGAR|nr:hypothetical protein F5890DRAFT_1478644 [Lentinula detonsa]
MFKHLTGPSCKPSKKSLILLQEKKRIEEKKRKEERKKKENEERKEKEEKEKREKEEKDWAASIARQGKESHPIDVDSIIEVEKKRKEIAMIALNGDPEGNDPNPGDNGDDSGPESDEYEEEKEGEEGSKKNPTPTPTPMKAKVKCLLVGNGCTIRRSKRLKSEVSLVASSSSERIDALKEHNRELAHQLYLVEDMVWFIVQTIRPVEVNEESEEDWVKRTGDVKGKGQKE